MNPILQGVHLIMTAKEQRRTYMYAIGLLVRSEEGVRNWHFDHLNGATLCIWCACQSVVGINRDLVLHARQSAQKHMG